jgi:hypothetical protein
MGHVVHVGIILEMQGGAIVAQEPVGVASCVEKKKENRMSMASYHKDVNFVVAHGLMLPRTHIPTYEIGEIIALKGMWQQAVKDVTY